MIGQTVGNYNITAFLGKGGMGQVYLAEHPRIGRRVAIKLLHSELSTDRRLVERLFDEALATNLVKHAGIVEVFDCGFHRDRAYLVMEFLEGESLAHLLKRERALGISVACTLGAQLASALGAAHEHQIVHRDLKPDNIFVMNGRQDQLLIKVVDFGIAKLTFRSTGSDTDSAVLLGTPAYMSPEQCAGARSIDPRTDIYALGCILFEMLVGRRPFIYQGWGEYIAAHQNESPPNPTDLRPALPPELNALILQMLAKRPDDRPSAMAEIEQHLTVIREGLGAPDGAAPPLVIVKATPLRNDVSPAAALPEPTVVSRRQQAAVRQRRRRWWMVPLAAAVILVAAGALLRHTWSPAMTKPPARQQQIDQPAEAARPAASVAPRPTAVAPKDPPPSVPALPPPPQTPTQPVRHKPRPRPHPSPATSPAVTPPAKRPDSDHFRGFEDL